MDIEKKALELVNEVLRERGYSNDPTAITREHCTDVALCRAIAQHEAFRREVSDAVLDFKICYPGYQHVSLFDRFIIAKPDPLVEALEEWINSRDLDDAASFRAALAARGLEIVKKEPSQ